MDKEAMNKWAQALDESAQALRVLTAERDALQSKLAAIETDQRCAKIAQQMIAKGINGEETADQLLSSLKVAADQGKLSEFERAVTLVGDDMGSKLASLANRSSASAMNALDQFITQ